jgi:hypothetical protein
LISVRECTAASSYTHESDDASADDRPLLAFAVTDSSFVPPLVYALMGSSKDLAVGTVAVASLLIGSMLSSEVSPTENPALYLHLALTATFFAGVFQASLGLLRYVTTTT